MSTSGNPIGVIPSAEQVLLPASNEVEIDGVTPALLQYAVNLAYIHWHLFGTPLVIRCGTDASTCGLHGHLQGMALDFLVSDLADEEFSLFYSIIGFSAPSRSVGVWWEFSSGQPTFCHVEYGN